MKPSSIKPEIALDDLERLDIRVGTIRRVTPVTGSRKLVALSVDFGDHERQVLAGIAKERDDPAEIEGLQALFVVNLPEREMAGMVSQGMLLDIGYADGIRPALACPERPVPNGARAG